MKSKKKLPMSKVYGHLECGPVVLVTSSLKGKPNVMPLSWLTMLDFEPPIFGIVFGGQSYTNTIVKKTKEFAINIPTADMLSKIIGCGKTTGRKIDKFAKFKLSTSPATKIAAPLLDDCYANFECKVIDTSMTKKYEFFVAKVVAAWIRPSKKAPKTIHHCSGREFIIAEKRIKAEHCSDSL